MHIVILFYTKPVLNASYIVQQYLLLFQETQYKSALEAMTDMSKTEVVDSVRMY